MHQMKSEDERWTSKTETPASNRQKKTAGRSSTSKHPSSKSQEGTTGLSRQTGKGSNHQGSLRSLPSPKHQGGEGPLSSGFWPSQEPRQRRDAPHPWRHGGKARWSWRLPARPRCPSKAGRRGRGSAVTPVRTYRTGRGVGGCRPHRIFVHPPILPPLTTPSTRHPIVLHPRRRK